jgi:hypothetical protein
LSLFPSFPLPRYDAHSTAIKGRWAFSKGDYDTGDPKKVSPFEFNYLGENGASDAASGGCCPPGGPYKGYIMLKVEGRPSMRVAENGMVFTFTAPLSGDGGGAATSDGAGGGASTQRSQARGTGHNKFGQFELVGEAWAASPESGGLFEVELYKSYTGPPLDPATIPKKKDKSGERFEIECSIKAWL